ncbi:DUF5959 family protein [Streptomyces sp. NPDC058001]|uniref:DUF5959 family protein n=1 Tax=Streptomyces sp. NPDC058001 TaxID=3346300 RepID=UPI0036EF6C52
MHDLIRLESRYDGGGVRVRVEELGPLTRGATLPGRIELETGFVSGRQGTYVFSEDLDAWAEVLDAVEQGRDASWRKDQRATEIHVRLLERTDSEDRLRVSVADRMSSLTTVEVTLDLATGWIEEHRAFLDQVRGAARPPADD